LGHASHRLPRSNRGLHLDPAAVRRVVQAAQPAKNSREKQVAVCCEGGHNSARQRTIRKIPTLRIERDKSAQACDERRVKNARRGEMARLFGAPELMPSGDGRLELFVFDIGGELWHIWQTAWSNGWSGWSAAGVGGEWPVAIARNGDGRLIVFMAGDFINSIEQTAWSNGWAAGPVLGSPVGEPTSVPTVAANADGRLIAFVSSIGQLWRIEQAVWGGGWNPSWTPHSSPPGQPVTGPPNIILDAQGCLQVFVVSESGEMWNIGQTAPAGTWSGWNSLGIAGAGFSDHPAVAPSADGRLELFVLGNDGALWHAWQLAVGGGWSGWVSFGDAGVGFQDHPALAPSADARLEVFVTGNDGNLWHRWQTRASNGWSPWFSHGNGGAQLVNGPALAASGDRRLEIFVTGADGNLWHIWQTAASNGWSGWVSLGQP